MINLIAIVLLPIQLGWLANILFHITSQLRNLFVKIMERSALFISSSSFLGALNSFYLFRKTLLRDKIKKGALALLLGIVSQLLINVLTHLRLQIPHSLVLNFALDIAIHFTGDLRGSVGFALTCLVLLKEPELFLAHAVVVVDT